MTAAIKPKPERPPEPHSFVLSLPKQHGAWSILLAGFALGVVWGGRWGIEAGLLLVAVLCGFCARHAAGPILRPDRSSRYREKVLPWFLGYVAGTLAAGAWLVFGLRCAWLLPLGGIALIATAASLFLEWRRQDRTAAGELLNILGVTLVIPAAAYVTTGVFEVSTVGLWALGFLFFGGSVFRVRYLVRQRRAHRGSLATRLRAGGPSIAYHLGALGGVIGLVSAGVLPALMPLALLPVTIKAIGAVAYPHKGPLNIRRIGYVELAHTLIFMALAIVSFRV